MDAAFYTFFPPVLDSFNVFQTWNAKLNKKKKTDIFGLYKNPLIVRGLYFNN